jgi:hypothetical protein
MALKPQRVLDVGVGLGTYGFLLRQYLDIAKERVARSEWQLAIDGIEVFEGYRNPMWGYAYNEVRVGDVRDLLPNLPKYDLALCNDVLEHFQHDEARNLVQRLIEKCGTVIATTPNVEFSQGAWGGNEAEAHRCLLKKSDFPHLVTWSRTGVTNCYVSTVLPRHISAIKEAESSCPVCTLPRVPLLKKGARKLRKLLVDFNA